MVHALALGAAWAYYVATGFPWLFFGVVMHRMPVNKHRSAKQFKRNVRKTKAPNMKAAPMRGGIRL